MEGVALAVATGVYLSACSPETDAPGGDAAADTMAGEPDVDAGSDQEPLPDPDLYSEDAIPESDASGDSTPAQDAAEDAATQDGGVAGDAAGEAGSCPGGGCGAHEDQCAAACLADGRECGYRDALCNCGDCAAGEVCDPFGVCIEDPCPAACEGRECGIVGAFYMGQSCLCGVCAQSYQCDTESFTCEKK